MKIQAPTILLLATLLLCSVCTPTAAETVADSCKESSGGLARLIKRVCTLMDTMSVKGIDRRYITVPERPWQVMIKGHVNQSMLKMNSTEYYDAVTFTLSPYLKTKPAIYAGLWAGYRGYGLGYTRNVNGDKSSYLTFGATGGSYGANLRIHSFMNDEPKMTVDIDISGKSSNATEITKLKAPFRVRTLIADAYYFFNGSRFSYPAAYDQSALQLRSAGSLMAGIMYYYAHINMAQDPNASLIEQMNGIGRVKLWQGSLGVGYAYNWVPTRGLLISAMAMPMLNLINKNRVYYYETNFDELLKEVEDQLVPSDEFHNSLRVWPVNNVDKNSGLTVNFNARLSLTYNFDRYFFNVHGQYYNFTYSHEDGDGRLNDWFVNASLGVRF